MMPSAYRFYRHQRHGFAGFTLPRLRASIVRSEPRLMRLVVLPLPRVSVHQSAVYACLMAHASSRRYPPMPPVTSHAGPERRRERCRRRRHSR